MQAQGLTQKALALKAGLNETAVRDIRTGKSRHPRHDTVQKLASVLACSVADLLGGAAATPAAALAAETPPDLWFVDVFDVAAAAGQGTAIDRESVTGQLAFRADWIRTVTQAQPSDLAVITIRGDSMYPTLADGDTVLVDLTQRVPRQDGIYVVRFDSYVLVKRLLIDPVRGKVTLSCDNPNYPPLAPVIPAEVDIAGRVIWLGRRV